MAKKKKALDKSGVISHMPDATPEDVKAINEFGFMPEDEPLDLTKAEKLRTTALLMAIQYVEKTICNDAQMYQELRRDGKQLIPATTPHVVRSAVQFENFLLGRYSDSDRATAAPVSADKDRPEPATEEVVAIEVE